MTHHRDPSFVRRSAAAVIASALALPPATALAQAAKPTANSTSPTAFAVLAPQLAVGDLVFIRIPFKPFLEVATATNTWTNHVGVVVDTSGAEPRIGESAFPLSRITTLSRFVKRSEDGRIAAMRLEDKLTAEQQAGVLAAASRRSGIFYDTGFDLHSRREFCSRYAREVLMEATGHAVGDVETFEHLLASRPDANLSFWRVWYFGRIPWKRETVTPASLLRSGAMHPVFDGRIALPDSSAPPGDHA